MYHHVLPLVSNFEKIDCQASHIISPSKVPLPVGIQNQSNTRLAGKPASPHPQWHRFNHFAGLKVVTSQTSRQTTLLRLWQQAAFSRDAWYTACEPVCTMESIVLSVTPGGRQRSGGSAAQRTLTFPAPAPASFQTPLSSAGRPCAAESQPVSPLSAQWHRPPAGRTWPPDFPALPTTGRKQ